MMEVQEIRLHIKNSRNIRIELQKLNNDLARLQKQMSLRTADLQVRVAGNKDLKNETQRKAELNKLLASDEVHVDLQRNIDAAKNEVGHLNIELQYNVDLIKLGLAVLSQPVVGEILTAERDAD